MADSRPKTVQIYLPNGNARGLRIARVTSSAEQAIQFPRQKIGAVKKREEAQQVGIYFLFGDVGDDASKPPAYIGEAENCLSRIEEHNRRKDFWTTAVAITSKTRDFTRTSVQRLEHDCILAAKDAQRFRLKNSNTPSEPHTPEAKRAELRGNFEAIQTLLSVLGFPILNALPSEEEASSEQTKLYCRGKKGADATGEYTEDGLVVFEGSLARTDTTPSASETVDRRRQNLLADGVLEKEGDQLVFRENHAFNTPSAASSTVLGRSSNGWREWTDGSGNSLDDLERQ
jgi:hypothetical protein